MANPEHVKWFLEGVDAWNKRREEEDFKPDLSGEDLRALFEQAGLLGVDRQMPELRTNLRGANLWQANLRGANLEEADLWGANLVEADLWGANLAEAYLGAADLMRANLQGTNLREAYLGRADLLGADVTTAVYSASGTNDVDSATFTDLSTALNLVQEQVDMMKGDSGTILPDHLTRPAHWPEAKGIHAASRDEAPSSTLSPPDHEETEPVSPEASAPTSRTTVQPKSANEVPYLLEFRKRPLSEIRKALLEDHTSPAALAQYMVDQIQRQIASHEILPKPNTHEGLTAWHNDALLLQEMLVTVQHLHDALPPSVSKEVSDPEADAIKSLLVQLVERTQAAITYLDNDTGTYGNFWKIGLIGTATQLLLLFGVAMPIAAPIAAGVIGVNTLRVYVGRDKP